MQLQAIAYFNELARCRSIREAAQNLGVSPTAISRQLENLEYHFGAPLVDRTARGIELTAAGELLVRRSRSAMKEFDLARQLIDDMRGLQRGEVTVYVNGATGGAILAGVLSGFSRDFPAIRASLLEGSATEALKAVHEGDADMALTLFSPSEPKVIARSRIPVRHAAILSPAHPAAGLAELSLETLCSYPLAMPDTSFSLRQAFEARLAAAGRAAADVVFTTPSVTIQKELARQGAAILILPEISVAREIRTSELVARPLAKDAAIDTLIQLSLPQGRSLSFAAEKLSAYLEARLRSYGEKGMPR